jgi:hypothetical protein
VQTTPTTYDQIITLDQEFRACGSLLTAPANRQDASLTRPWPCSVSVERKLPAELHCSEDSCVLPTDGNGWIDKTFILQRHAMLIMIVRPYASV